MLDRNWMSLVGAIAATWAATATAHAITVTPNPDAGELFTQATAASNNNPSVPNTGTVSNDVFYPSAGSSGSQENTVGGSASASMSLSFAPAGMQGQATATTSNVQTFPPAFDNTSASANFAGILQLNFMVVGPALPFPSLTIPVDVQGALSVQSSAPSNLINPSSGTHVTAEVDIGNTAIQVFSAQGSTNNISQSFTTLTQVFPNVSANILMSMNGLASSFSGSGSAGGTVSVSAEIDPFFFIDTLLFAEWYPNLDINQYSIVLNAEFLNIPAGAGDATTPLPGALPLFASGLGGLSLLGWRRKKKAKALA
jgi:hypothetical protein